MFRLTVREKERPAVDATLTELEPGDAPTSDAPHALPTDDPAALAGEGRRLSRAAVLESLRLALRIPRRHTEEGDRLCDALLASYVRFARVSRGQDEQENLREARGRVLQAAAHLASLLRLPHIPRESAWRLFVLVEQLTKLAEAALRKPG